MNWIDFFVPHRTTLYFFSRNIIFVISSCAFDHFTCCFVLVFYLCDVDDDDDDDSYDDVVVAFK